MGRSFQALQEIDKYIADLEQLTKFLLRTHYTKEPGIHLESYRIKTSTGEGFVSIGVGAPIGIDQALLFYTQRDMPRPQ